MRKVESNSISYMGYKEPQTREEVEFEILGLETVVAAVKQQIAILKQSVVLKEMISEAKDMANEETVEKTPNTEKAEQEG